MNQIILTNQFSPRLEAIRGLAALMVALFHSMGAVLLTTPVDHWLKQASTVLGNGGTGVTIFFVLSGHVLGLSMVAINIHPLRYWPIFMLRRVLRIYPAMLVCLGVCAALLAWVYNTPAKFPAASSAYYEYWQYGVNWTLFYKNILLIENYINPVTWTLQVEILGAMAFPFLYAIKSRYPVASLFLLGAWLLYFVTTPLYVNARTGFLYMFLAGLYVTDVSRWLYLRLPPNMTGKIAIISGLGCCTGHLILPETTPWGWILESAFALIMLAALNAFPNRLRIPGLDRREVRFLGKVSYSFYLWHFPVLYIVTTEMFRLMDSETLLAHPVLFQWVLFSITSLLTLPIASLSYKWVELPCKASFWRKTQLINQDLLNPAQTSVIQKIE
ncbi:MAG: acyltransferase [Methylobacter sp.]|nr:acyltransferase [Candidatus Methylobacter titanis]